MISPLHDLVFPTIVHEIGTHLTLRVVFQLDPALLGGNQTTTTSVVSAAVHLQRSVAQILAYAAAATASAGPQTVDVTVIGATEDGGKQQLQLEKGNSISVVVNFTSWLSFFSPSTAKSEPSNIQTFFRTADFLVNVAAPPSLFRGCLQLVSGVQQVKENAAEGFAIFPPGLASLVKDAVFISSSPFVQEHGQNSRGVFAGGFRLVALLLFFCSAGQCSLTDLFLFFSRQRDFMQDEAVATLLDVSGARNDDGTNSSSQERLLPSAEFERSQSGSIFSQFGGPEDLLGSQMPGALPRSALMGAHRRSRAADNDDDDNEGQKTERTAVLVEDALFSRFASGCGRADFEFHLRRRSSALLVWSTLRRIVPPSQWILDMLGNGHRPEEEIISADLFNLFLVGSAAAGGGGSICGRGAADLEEAWLRQCSMLNTVSFAASPEQPRRTAAAAAAESTAASLLGCSSRLWWRKALQQKLCIRLSLDMERGSSNINDAAESLLRGLSVKIDCCHCCSQQQQQQQEREDASGSSDVFSSIRADLDVRLVRDLVGNNEKQFAFAQSLSRPVPSFSFPILLLHFALVSNPAEVDSGSLIMMMNAQQQQKTHRQRFVVCVYGAIASCDSSSTPPLTFSEETATIVSTKRLLQKNQQGGLLRRYDFDSVCCASRAMEFAAACQDLASVPFRGFVHAVADPSCTAPRSSFNVLDSGAFSQQRNAVLRFFSSELHRRAAAAHQPLDQLSSLILQDVMKGEKKLQHDDDDDHDVAATASEMAAAATFHLFRDRLITGHPNWVQRFLPPPKGAKEEREDAWRNTMQRWGAHRVAFVLRRALSHHLRKSIVVSVLPNPNKNHEEDSNRQQQQQLGGNFSTLYQAAVLDHDQQLQQSPLDASAAGAGQMTQRDNAATALLLFSAATGNQQQGDSKVGQLQQQIGRRPAADLVMTSREHNAPSVGILRKWFKVFS